MLEKNWNKIGIGAFVAFFLALVAYFTWQLKVSLTLQYGGEWERLGGFFRWILGYVLILVVILVLGLLNFLGPYRWWRINKDRKWLYRCWILILFSFLYLFLYQWTYFREDLVEENLLLSILALLFILGFTSIAALIRSRNEQTKLLQQQTAAELKALRGQLNPHFLFNALNTLYGQAVPLEDQSLADRIQELSGILRFTLQQAQKEYVPFHEEYTFLQRYIALQKSRLANPEQVKVDLYWDDVPAQIPPLLLLPFVENLFKHGLSSRGSDQARIELTFEDGKLFFYTENDLSPRKVPGTGKGIEQTKRRLAIRYPGSHSLAYGPSNGKFKVSLSLML
ncbi:MAG: histidine kinase [Bacteroidia bacterium]|nr:histidine kinase [Bacteroidia bacterium]